jgi:ADP-ribosyl-[dinitrogen reductase] hydrolase
MDNLLDRQRGCLVGLAVGDALGVPAEFKQRGKFDHITTMRGGGPFNLNPGEWTDDTSMALCLAEELIASRDEINLISLHGRWWRWFQGGENSHNGRCFDIGNTTRVGLYLNRYAKKTGEFKFPGNDPMGASNGSIMRQAPTMIRWASDPNMAVAQSMLQGRITHGNHEAVSCTEVLCHIVLDIFETGKYDQRFNWLIRDPVTGSAFCWETLSAALWAVSTTHSFRDALEAAVNLGDDADTVGAVTGQIAGALYGLNTIPGEWLEVLAWKDRIIALADDLAILDVTDGMLEDDVGIEAILQDNWSGPEQVEGST